MGDNSLICSLIDEYEKATVLPKLYNFSKRSSYHKDSSVKLIIVKETILYVIGIIVQYMQFFQLYDFFGYRKWVKGLLYVD